ncbi:Formylglycine-generating enzyme, required for sulfatase activity, contains SUMF1/FGE domain [Acinetobacter marinus]|uniref:Formylglycine-generating enzyme, required for sulfatase activity, contains SUMF1/FGE domain n=1 Tax=Acinetobacter marinus TaxID=281375 RepID=A0A1G6LMB3_9GAMM|nr:SUMF1/EgtB/PvdO family nonheme iron enzyme [Acinetobacter marinus]SDC44428.1 Formylglycine-generating enzyme, required for sulfatase activity, contains SUMF1/FGE domain [Acinetobacter marinus]
MNTRFFTISALSLSLLYAGCGAQQQHTNVQSTALKLGSLSSCQQYSGLPAQWQKQKIAGMRWIPKGEFQLGSDLAYQDELNFGEKTRHSGGYWIDQTEVTVAQFRSFIEATGYVTDAEKQQQAAVFAPQSTESAVQPNQSTQPSQPTSQWWQLRSGYTWKTPNGLNGKAPKPSEAVRYISKNDAEHYAVWLGHDLPTELEWEYAAKAGDRQDTPMHQEPKNHHEQPQANYWQGEFPYQNSKLDHFEGVAPVGCFPANAFGLYDMIGNVWEWTSSPYHGAHDQHMGDYQSLRQLKTQVTPYVIKGGSFLCANNFCARFRSSSRYPQEFDLAATHVGFRTVYRGD